MKAKIHLKLQDGSALERFVQGDEEELIDYFASINFKLVKEMLIKPLSDDVVSSNSDAKADISLAPERTTPAV